MSVTFNDSLEHNLNLLDELIKSLPPQHKNGARRAANLVEKTFNQLKDIHAGDAGAALGTAWAFFKISQNLVKPGTKGKGGDSLIQLLN